MNHPLVAASLLLLTSTLVAADPIVTGNTISWPDDGWYQVQVVTDDGISEVCAGTRSCEVDPGIYIVINHTTGERFRPVVVNADPDEFDPADLPTIRAENWPEILRNVIALINADRAVERHGMLLDRFASLSGFVVSESFVVSSPLL